MRNVRSPRPDSSDRHPAHPPSRQRPGWMRSTGLNTGLACTLIALVSLVVSFSHASTQSAPQPAVQPSSNQSIFLPFVSDGNQEISKQALQRDIILNGTNLECNLLSPPINVTVPQWNSSSGWSTLTDNPDVVAIEVTVISGGAGNVIHLVEDWGAVVASQEVASGIVVVEIPTSVDVSESVQFYIEHATGSEFQASINLCVESDDPPPTPTNTPTHTPTNTPVNNPPTNTPTNTPTATHTPIASGSANCTIEPATSNITLGAGDWATNWRPLLEDKSLRDQITGVQFTINSSGGAGNSAAIYEDWAQPAIASVVFPNGPTVERIALPASANTRLQIQVENNQQVAVDIDIMLCTGNIDSDPPTPTPTFTPTPGGPTGPASGMPKVNASGQLVPGQASGLPLSAGFGDWSNHPGVAGTLSSACVDLHDSHWVEGDDGKAYHTWHPPAELHPITNEGCVYGHEHGDNPFNSPLFAYSGGWPAFGFALEQFNSTLPAGEGPRVEDHFGHKVTVATYQAAIGNPPNTDVAIYDAGFKCHFMSKIHQGSHSDDAFVNHLHEYYVNLACDDVPGNPGQGVERTKFSLKMVVPFGEPNEFRNMCFDGNVNLMDAAGNVTGLNGQLLPLAQVLNPTPAQGSNPREFTCMSPNMGRFQHGTVDYFNQNDLWTQLNGITGPGNIQVNFQPYYVVKDTVRMYDDWAMFAGDPPSNTEAVRYTVDLCQQFQSENLTFCEALFANNGGAAPDAYSATSTFRGALRAVNFKVFPIYNNSTSRSSDDFCTDATGTNAGPATNGICPAGQVLQKIANTFDGNNDWWTWTNPATGVTGAVSGSLYVQDQPVKYPTFDDATNTYSFVNGLQQPNANGNGCPYGPVALPSGAEHAYCPVGIGFEKIVDLRNSVPQAVKNAVQLNPNTGQPYNTGIHAPN